MAILTETVEMTWNVANKEYYILNGHIFTYFRDRFKVNINDLHKGSKRRIEVMCDKCGICKSVQFVTYLSHQYTIKNNFGDYLCANCAKGQRTRTQEKFEEQVFNIHGSDYSIVGLFVRDDAPVEIVHNICGYKYAARPSNIIKGSKCPKCSKRIKNKTTEYFKQEVFALVGDDYTVLGEYRKNSNTIEFRHNICGNIYSTIPHYFLSGSRCVKCASSRGEKAISDYLIKNNISFKQEYRFEKCKDKRMLPFDFVIFDENKKLATLLEFDGEQHTRPVRFGGMSLEKAEKAFKLVEKRDIIKSNYCLINNIPLIRISYRDFDHIEEILTLELIKLNINIAM